MKKLAVAALAVLASTLPGCRDTSPGGPPPAEVCNTLMEVDFIAGRTTRIGSVIVGNSNDTLSLTLSCDEGWFMTVSHIAVADSPENLPQTGSGNPIPGQFPFARHYSPAVAQDGYGIPLPATTDREIYVAVHAEVFRRVSTPDDDDKDDDKEETNHETAWAAGENFRGRNWGMYFKYTLQDCTPNLSGLFRTETQSAWGAVPDGRNAATLLLNSFGAAFPLGLTIGSTNQNQARFTNADAILGFLPQAGSPAPLPRSFVNPGDLQNEFAGQVTALALNLGFDLFDPAFGKSDVSLGSLIVADSTSPFFGASVDKVLVFANRVLGAEVGVGFTPEQMNEVVTRINENFANGTTDGGFLRLP